MATILIHYFTGTGNTAHAVSLIRDQLVSAGHRITVLRVSKGVVPPTGIFDYHIIAFPVLSWSAPVMMKKYIRKMPRSQGDKTAILAVNGAIIYKGKLVKGFTGQALEQLECILHRKKYDVLLTGNASFPDNWTQVTNPCDKQDTEAIFPIGEAEVQVFVQNFLAGKRELYRCGHFHSAWTFLVAGLFCLIGRRFLGKFYIADSACTGCAICAKTCPAGTIHMQYKKPVWGTQCEDCNRCINLCPERAIQVSLPLFILHTVINFGLTIWAIRAVIVYVPEWIQTGSALRTVIEIPLIIAVTILLLWVSMVPVDLFFRLLMQIPVVRGFFSKSYTKQYRRYKAPGFEPLKK
jgi:Pyruvate/2-oxoacid:ferredoxin oxidoreductase delta subunit/flavodoxin